jgi:hypothetical protein
MVFFSNEKSDEERKLAQKINHPYALAARL